jgi:uncharacterized protein (TIGR00369 family)
MTQKFQAPFTYESQNPEFKALIADKISRQYFMNHIGFQLTHIEAGYMEGSAPIVQSLRQQDGRVHGGVTATVADLVTGFAAFSLVGPDDRVVTSDLKISYFSPGMGDTIFGRGWVIKPGKRLHYCEGEIYTIDGDKLTLIAKATAIMAVIHNKNRELPNQGQHV